MTGLPKRAARALHWRVNALLGTGATKVPREPERPHATQEVGDYYDRFTQTYLDATGPFLQAFRGRDTDALMEYYVARCDLADGMEIVDAGCGVGGPAIWLARRFPAMKIECLTNSRVQASKASANAAAAGVEDRVKVTLGDYHDLSRTYPHDRFDRVLFLETLGHCEDIRSVLYGVRDILKQGGLAYIKDFFQRRSLNAHHQAKIDDAVKIINANYCYHVMQLPDLVAACMETGFTVASVTPPDIEPDLRLTVDFEHAAGRLTYPAYARFPAVDWYEVVARCE